MAKLDGNIYKEINLNDFSYFSISNILVDGENRLSFYIGNRLYQLKNELLSLISSFQGKIEQVRIDSTKKFNSTSKSVANTSVA